MNTLVHDIETADKVFKEKLKKIHEQTYFDVKALQQKMNLPYMGLGKGLDQTNFTATPESDFNVIQPTISTTYDGVSHKRSLT